MAKRTLKARDVEQLENTSLASALLGGVAVLGTPRHDLMMHGAQAESCPNVTCIAVSCIGNCVTICNTPAATANGQSLVCLGTCPAVTQVPQIPPTPVSVPIATHVCVPHPTAQGCGGTMQGGQACY